MHIYAFAQCTRLSNGDIDGKLQKIGTSPQAMAAPMFAHASISYSPTLNGLYFLYLNLEFRDIQTIHEGSKVILYFEDQTSIELIVDKTEISEPENGAPIVQNGRIWNNSVAFTLNADQIAKMKGVKFSRVTCADADYTYSAKSKSQAAILQEALLCIDKNK